MAFKQGGRRGLWPESWINNNPSQDWVPWWSANRGSTRGAPEPLSDPQRRQPSISNVIPFGTQQLKQIRRNDWGADGWAYTGGKVPINPIGAGVNVPYRLQPLSRGTSQALFGVGDMTAPGIYWTSQQQNYGQGPLAMPLYTPAELAALVGPVVAQSVSPGAGPSFG